MSNFIYLFIPWIVLSACAASIADEKGYSGTGAFLMSILLSPVVGLLYAMGRPINTEAIIKHNINAGLLKRCPSCQEAIKIKATLCKHCHTQQNG